MEVALQQRDLGWARRCQWLHEDEAGVAALGRCSRHGLLGRGEVGVPEGDSLDVDWAPWSWSKSTVCKARSRRRDLGVHAVVVKEARGVAVAVRRRGSDRSPPWLKGSAEVSLRPGLVRGGATWWRCSAKQRGLG